MNAICLLCIEPHEIWIDFLNTIKLYDIYMIINNNNYLIPDKYIEKYIENSKVKIIKINDNKCLLSGFNNACTSIKLERSNICLALYIPRGLENLYDDEEFLTQIQMVNYRLIEIVNPKYLIIMSNYCIKMLLATDLSSMSLRGKWFDFNTPNDTTPKKCRVLYEPEILINNPELKKDAWEDLKEIQKQLGG